MPNNDVRTARIQSCCNQYNVDILVSDNLIQKLSGLDAYTITEIGACELRGKDEKVLLKTISKK